MKACGLLESTGTTEYRSQVQLAAGRHGKVR